ncbi:hypothetical protein [Vibrio alfacsensis]|uniref:hypothetical protein n=1 Tax=Vibrio alfacsensis TaxID=1074311 RepID=UPI0040676FC8
MKRLGIKRLRIKQVCTLLLALAGSYSASAAEIAAKITGDRLQWLSANSQGDDLVPSAWDLPHNLPAASKWVPGGPINDAPISLTFNGVGVEGSLTLNSFLEVRGIDYQSAPIDSATDITGSSSVTSLNGNSVTVIGAGIANKRLTLSELGTPFTHIRPVIKLNEAVLIHAFKDSTLSQGRYQSQTLVKVQYDYYRNGIRIRNTLSYPLSVVVHYHPAELLTIDVSPNNVIEPRYHGHPNIKVSGETQYTITATGTFVNGIWVGLRAPAAGEPYFRLKPEDMSDTTEIKYDVTCIDGCDGANIAFIQDGIGQINDSTNRAKINARNGTTAATAVIKVGFNDKPLADLSHGTYQGSFILVFEAGL